VTEKTRERLLSLIGPAVGIALVAVAAIALEGALREYQLRDILAHLAALPRRHLLLALLLTVSSYFVLTGYDALSLRVLGRTLEYPKIALASFTGYVFSHNIGLFLFGSGAVRYRMLTTFGVSSGDIARTIALNTLTFWLGFLALGGISLTLDPITMPPPLSRVMLTTYPLGLGLLVTLLVYLTWSARRTAALGGQRGKLSVPSLPVTFLQISLACFDLVLAGAALFVLLPPVGELGFSRFLGIYLLSIVVGLLSGVPGGLGVLETVLVVLLRPYVPGDRTLAALLAYRAIYYLLPMLVAVGGLVAFEVWQRREHLVRARRLIAQVGPTVVPQVLSLWLVAAGLVLLVSGATPADPERFAFVTKTLPLAVIEISHLLGSALGVALLLLAYALQRRVDAAYYASLVVLIVGIAASLAKGFDWEEASLLAGIAIALLPCRRYFHRKSSLLAQPYAAEWALLIVIAVVGTVVVSLLAHRHVEYANELWWRFELDGHASRSLRAIVAAGLVAALWPLARLLRPAAPIVAGPSELDLDRARPIVAASRSVEAHLALLGDKQFLFHPSEDAFVMYGVRGRSWIAMGDPTGPAERRSELAWRFLEEADIHGGHAAFYEVGVEDLPIYVDLGMSLRKLGESARVSLSGFTLEGSDRKDLRYEHRRGAKDGCRFEIIEPSEVPAKLDLLAAISSDWLVRKSAREKRFSLGCFDRRYLSLLPAALVWRDNEIVAFANCWLGADKYEMAIDLMRFSHTAPQHVMDFLFVELMQWGAAQGYAWFDLGMAPLSGLESHRLAPAWNRLGTLVYRHGEHFYNFRGLRSFKQKFAPIWEPKYLASSADVPVAVTLLRIAALVSGGVTGVVTR